MQETAHVKAIQAPSGRRTRTTEPILVVEGLSRRFILGRRRAPVEAVRGLSLSVDRHEVFAFLGPNGAGKTTTLRILTTLDRPSSGRVLVAGYNLASDPSRIRPLIGYVSQSGGADYHATVRQNLLVQARLYGLSRKHALPRTEELLDRFQLTGCADRIVRTLSGGQRRRVDLALGIVHEPQLLFLDEPTTGLDPQSRSWFWNEIRGLRDRGSTIFITTHYLEEADALADRVAIIDDGRMVAEGTPTDLKREVSGEVVRLAYDAEQHLSEASLELIADQSYVHSTGRDGHQLLLYVDEAEQHLSDLLRLLESLDARPARVSLERPSLDDVFLARTGRSLRDTD